MGTISYNYDTAAIRREARKLKSCYERLADSAVPRVNGVRAKLEGEFEGRAAAALDSRLLQMWAEVKGLSTEIKGLYTALMRYADALEEADERMARLMGK